MRLVGKPFFVVCLALGATLAMASVASAYLAPPATFTYGATDPNPGAVVHAGTINTGGLAFGTFLGGASGYGTSGAAVGWDDNWTGGGSMATNGNALDGYWVQITQAGFWDLGAATSTVAVFSSQDHGGYLGEGMEYRVYGSNDQVHWSAQQNASDVYLDGWRAHNPAEDLNGNGWTSDDISVLFQMDAAYRYVMLTPWGNTKPGVDWTEPEIDAVAGARVPEPGTLMLLGSGLVGLVASRKRIRK